MTMDEFNSVVELLGALLIDPRTVLLFALLTIAAVSDYRTYKIPNWLTASGLAIGLIYSVATPPSLHTGFLWALGGVLLGFVMMLPLYVLKAMGAGDVKLMAMVGSFLGAADTFNAVILTFVVGGIAALAFALSNKALARLVCNVKNIVQVLMLSAIGGIRPDVAIDARKSVGRLPYGISISFGTMGYVVARQLGYL